MQTAAAEHIETEAKVVRFTSSERRVFRPKDDLTVSQWSPLYRKVTSGSRKGAWSNDFVPYAVEPMDCWNLPWVRKVYLRWAPQTSKTNIAFNCLDYSVDQDPGPAMYIMSEEKTAKRISRRRIIPMFRETPRLATLLSPRVDDTTTMAVLFQNGMDLMMGWAGSAALLASEAVRYLFLDEVDKYPDFTGKEADPISLAEVRTVTYPYTKKIMMFSTPTDENGPITRAMEDDADEVRKYEAKCPICGEFQIMEFESIHWPKGSQADHRLVKRKKLARYACTGCGMDWDDRMKDKAVKSGRWVSGQIVDGKWIKSDPIHRPEAIGFELASWYSPDVSLSDAAAAFLRGLTDPAKLMAFVTQHKAEAWKEVVEPKEESKVLEHRIDLPAMVVPSWALALTCGIDVQKVGFWFVVRAWGEGLRNHLVHYGYMSTFDDVESLIFETNFQISQSDKTMRVWRAAMDTGGGKLNDDEWTRTEEIYHWLRNNGRGIVHGIKGASRPQLKRVNVRVIDKMTVGNRVIPGGLELRMLDTAQFKDILHWRLTRKDGESQHSTLHSETGMDYAKQFLAEEKRRTRKKKIEWVQVRRDNHLLDAEVYASACADSEWLPSFDILAREHLAANQNKLSDKKQITENKDYREGINSYDRPDWLNR